MEMKVQRSALPESIAARANQGNVFFSAGYADYVGKRGGDMVYIYDESFLLPVRVERKAGIRFATFSSEPLCLSDGDKEEYSSFLDQACHCLKEYGVIWAISAAGALFRYYPEKSLRIPFGSHVLDLSLSEEELFALMHSKHRNGVRRAEKNGVEIRCGGEELLKDYLEMDRATWARSGKAASAEAFFQDMFRTMGHEVIFYIAYKNEKPQAGACFYYNSVMSYYMFGCSADAPETGAANLLHWRAICQMKAQGVKQYSFVGCRINEDADSKYHTIQRFKERFGGELIRGYMFKVILRPLLYNVFAFLYRLKNKTPLSDAVDQEIKKWKELN